MNVRWSVWYVLLKIEALDKSDWTTHTSHQISMLNLCEQNPQLSSCCEFHWFWYVKHNIFFHFLSQFRIFELHYQIFNEMTQHDDWHSSKFDARGFYQRRYGADSLSCARKSRLMPVRAMPRVFTESVLARSLLAKAGCIVEAVVFCHGWFFRLFTADSPSFTADSPLFMVDSTLFKISLWQI